MSRWVFVSSIALLRESKFILPSIVLFICVFACRSANADSGLQPAEVKYATFSSDGNTLATGTINGIVELWDLKTNQKRRLYAGQWNATNTADGPIALWDGKQGEHQRILGKMQMVLAFSRDGGTIAVPDLKSIMLWDVKTGRMMRRIPHEGSFVGCLSFSPDGQLLAAGASDGTITLWDINTGTMQLRLTPDKTDRVVLVSSVVFSPAGKTIAAADKDAVIKVWDVGTGKVAWSSAEAGEFVSFSQDGKNLVSCAISGILNLWDAKSGAKIACLSHNLPYLVAAAFSPDGKTLVSVRSDGGIALWDVKSGKCRSSSGYSSAPADEAWMGNCVDFSPNRETVAFGLASGKVALVDAATGKKRRWLDWRPYQFWSPAFSPDGKTLGAASSAGTIAVFDLVNHKSSRLLCQPGAGVVSVSFSPDGKIVASGGADGNIELWDATTGAEQQRLSQHADMVRCTSFSPDGKVLVSGANDGTIKEWDVKTGKEILSIALPSHREKGRGERGNVVARDVKGRVAALCFSPDGKSVASGYDTWIGSNDPGFSPIDIWDVKTGKLKQQFPCDETVKVSQITFGPDGKTIATSSFDGAIKLWDVGTGKLSAEPTWGAPWGTCVSYSPNASVLAVDGSEVMELWDVKTGKKLRRFSRQPNGRRGLCFSRDGKILASAGDDGTIEIWNLETGTKSSSLSWK